MLFGGSRKALDKLKQMGLHFCFPFWLCQFWRTWNFEDSVSLMMFYPDTTVCCWALFILRRQGWYLVTRVMDKFSRGRPRQSSSKCELQQISIWLLFKQNKQFLQAFHLFMALKCVKEEETIIGNLTLTAWNTFQSELKNILLVLEAVVMSCCPSPRHY